jgi:hypothetical protein
MGRPAGPFFGTIPRRHGGAGRSRPGRGALPPGPRACGPPRGPRLPPGGRLGRGGRAPLRRASAPAPLHEVLARPRGQQKEVDEPRPHGRDPARRTFRLGAGPHRGRRGAPPGLRAGSHRGAPPLRPRPPQRRDPHPRGGDGQRGLHPLSRAGGPRQPGGARNGGGGGGGARNEDRREGGAPGGAGRGPGPRRDRPLPAEPVGRGRPREPGEGGAPRPRRVGPREEPRGPSPPPRGGAALPADLHRRDAPLRLHPRGPVLRRPAPRAGGGRSSSTTSASPRSPRSCATR